MTPAERFEELFGAPPSVFSDAPGRVNVIGEHTDYSGGFVFPAAIPLRCRVVLGARSDRTVRAFSENRREDGILEYELGRETPGRGWLDYVQGLTVALRDRPETLGGFDLAVAADIPPGAGLASSAALEVAVLRALRAAFGLALDDVAIARIGRKAENEFVGAPVGIMDQMASSLASEGCALFLDTQSLAHEELAIPDAAELAVIDSGIPHEHAQGGYRERRAECDEAARRLGVGELRDLLREDPETVARTLPDPLGRRVRHVLTENARVLDAVQAFRAQEAARVGELMKQSHRSLAEDFEASTPELDLLSSLANAHSGVFGARLTGGGFGGSVVLLARRGEGRAAAKSVAEHYERRCGRAATVLLPSRPPQREPQTPLARFL